MRFYEGASVSCAAGSGVEAGLGAPARLRYYHTGRKVDFVVVVTQEETLSVQDAPAGKLNKHWQRSFRRAAWPKQTAVERTERGQKV